MEIISIHTAEEEEIKGPLFTGGQVWLQSLLNEKFEANGIQVANVKFAPGARNKFHTHSTEQILFVTEGKGIVATRDQQQMVEPGTLIYFSPGEEHWHGATEDSPFAHLSIISPHQEMKIME